MYSEPTVKAYTQVPNRPSSLTVLAILLGLVLPLLIYIVLPELGIKHFANFLPFNRLQILPVLLIGGTLYFYYISHVFRHTNRLVNLFLLGFPWLAFAGALLMDNGINIYLSVWQCLLFILPSILIGSRCIPLLPRCYPFFTYFLTYLIIVSFYFVFWNHQVQDPQSNAGLMTLGFHVLFNHILQFSSILFTGSVILQHQNPDKVLRQATIAMVGSLFAIALFIAFTFNNYEFYTLDEGMWRVKGIFFHSNSLAHYLITILIPLLGLFFYYQNQPNTGAYLRWGLGTSFILGCIILLMTVCKTATIALIAGCILLIALHVLFQKNFSRILLNLFSISIITIISIIGLQIYTDGHAFDSLTTRFETSSSMDWRSRVWDYLLYDMDPKSTVIGKGLSAANDRMSRFEGFNIDQTSHHFRKVVQVHNCFLNQFYDFGILGLLPFIGLLVYLIYQVRHLFSPTIRPSQRILATTGIALVISYSILCFFDNTFFMPEIPFWLILTLLYGMQYRLHQSLMNNRVYE